MAASPYPSNTLSEVYRYKEIEIEIGEGEGRARAISRSRLKKQKEERPLERLFLQIANIQPPETPQGLWRKEEPGGEVSAQTPTCEASR